MTITLAATWEPRGELARFQRMQAQLRALYETMVLVLPPEPDEDVLAALREIEGTRVVITTEWVEGRYRSLEAALDADTTHVHYADFDRLLRWLETRPDELARTIEHIQTCDALIIGRSERAFGTHPQALARTEMIINRVFSYLLDQPLDFPSGSKGFSRRAVEVLLANTTPKRGLGTDTEWAVVLHRAGFTLTSVAVDGLDWETADRYRDSAASDELQQREADAYDTEANHWAYRAEIADSIVRAGLDAMQRQLAQEEGNTP